MIFLYAYNKHFSFQPAINFVEKGGKGKNASFTYDYKFSYLEVPLNFLYYFKGKTTHFFFGAGPWFAAGIGGKADALVGCKMKSGFLISAGYSAGLHSIAFHNDKIMNYYWTVKIGYALASKKVKP